MKKSLIDKVLLEWSYRCDDGIPDINDPKKVNILKEMLGAENILEAPPQLKLSFEKEKSSEEYKKEITDLLDNASEEDLRLISKRLKSQLGQKVEELKPLLKEKNIESLYKLVYNVALEFGEADELINYLSKDVSKSSFSEQIMNKSEGNVVDIFKKIISSVPKDSQFSEALFRYLLKLDASIKRTSIGAGEIALILLFGDVKKGDKKGDLDVNGKTIEVKGKDSRLALPNRKLTDQSSKKIVLNKIKPFLKKYNIDVSSFDKKGITWLMGIKNFYNQFEGNKNEFIKDFKEEVIKKIYTDLNLDDSAINEFFSSDEGVKKISDEIALKLVEEFMKENPFLFLLNPNTGNYVFIKNFEEFKKLFGTSITRSSFSDELPRINYIKE